MTGQKLPKGKACLKSKKLVLSEGESRIRRGGNLKKYGFIAVKGSVIWGKSPKGNWKECPVRGTLKVYSEIKETYQDLQKMREATEETCLKKRAKTERAKDAGQKLNKERGYVDQAGVQSKQCRKKLTHRKGNQKG